MSFCPHGGRVSQGYGIQRVQYAGGRVSKDRVLDVRYPGVGYLRGIYPTPNCQALLLFYSYCQRRVLGSRGLLVVYVFIFYQTLRVVPHGTKGTGPRFVTRPAYLRSQFRNNTNTVSTLVPLLHLLQVLCTRYASVAHHRALQTSGRGWADSKAVHGMECSGARSLYWRSLSVGAAA